jgi:hypothetical protein
MRPVADNEPRLTALPPVGARVLAFASILLAGGAGGLIGWAFVNLQCTGSCNAPRAIGAIVGALLSALGVAVVAILCLRAMSEWKARS